MFVRPIAEEAGIAYILAMDYRKSDLPTLIDPAREEEYSERVEEGFWLKMRQFASRIPFAREALAAWYCVRDPATPAHVRLVLLAALAYFVVPTDAVPDFLGVLGLGDDAAVFWAAWRMVGSHVTDRHLELASQVFEPEHEPAMPERR